MGRVIAAGHEVQVGAAETQLKRAVAQVLKMAVLRVEICLDDHASKEMGGVITHRFRSYQWMLPFLWHWVAVAGRGWEKCPG